jgi:DNA-binding FadR family transcriptional regulator
MSVLDVQRPGRTMRPSLAHETASRIEATIGRSGLRAGDRIGTKEELRREYEVSAGTMNEALRLLQSADVVALRSGPTGGVFVRQLGSRIRFGSKMLSLSSESIRAADCLAVRDALELLVALEAARHATRSDIRDLKAALRKMRLPRQSPADALRATWSFHRRIAEISPNVVLRDVYLGMLDFIDARLEDVSVDAIAPERASIRHSVHAAIVDAITEHDEAAVRKAIERHTGLTAPPSLEDPRRRSRTIRAAT